MAIIKTVDPQNAGSTAPFFSSNSISATNLVTTMEKKDVTETEASSV
jgi:hypothetical protein